MTQVDTIFGWASFIDADFVELLGSMPRREGVLNSAFFIAPDIFAVTLADNIWRHVNEHCNTHLDQAEEEQLEPSASMAVASALAEVVRERYGTGNIVREVAVSDGLPIVISVEGARIRRVLEELAMFLKQQAKDGRTVYVQF